MAENVEEKSSRRRKRKAEDAEEEIIDDAERGVTTGKGRITPGRRRKTDDEGGGNIVTRSLRGMNEYRKGVFDELSKVTWPTREEMLRLSAIVLATLIVSAIALGALSFAFTELFILGFENELVFAVMFAVIIAGFVVFSRLGRNNNTPY